MLSEQTLRQLPRIRQLPGFFKLRVHPVYRPVTILDPLSGFRIVLHNLTAPQALMPVKLPKDNGPGLRTT